MNRDDPEARIAELERQLAAQRRVAELERQLADTKAATGGDHAVEQPTQLSDMPQANWQDAAAHKRESEYPKTFQPRLRGRGRNGLYWWILALIPTFWVVTKFLGLTALLIAIVVFGVVTVGYHVLQRRNLDGEKIIGGIIGALGGLSGIVTVLNIQFPSSVLWMSRIVCSSPYRLEYDTSHYSVRPGESTSTVDYVCVSGEGAYDVNDFVVWGLQAVLVLLVLCPVVAVGFLVRRRLQTRS